DRPFLPFGVAESIANPVTAFAMGGSSGIDDTILRRVNPAYQGGKPGDPLIWVPKTTVTSQTGLPDANPYLQTEAARKILNNTTPVSHTFAVYLTVGFFEVQYENDPAGAQANNPSLGLGAN